MMNYILGRFKNAFKFNLFEIIVVLCLVFILGYGLYNVIKGKQGTWTNKNIYDLLPPPEKYKTQIKPKKKDSKGETECRRVLVKFFGKPFDKARPSFLNNPVTGGSFNLELDCYNEELNLAVEYNGKQHYEFCPFFHKNKEHFLNQKYRDDMKRRMCKDHNITLIEVPYTVPEQQIEQYLKDNLKKKNII